MYIRRDRGNTLCPGHCQGYELYCSKMTRKKEVYVHNTVVLGRKLPKVYDTVAAYYPMLVAY